ncbi:MAG: GTP cyclohydrolase I [Anaeroplasmataceae bacterium]|nr:GTP cyclohydrolase I [Anaeroplasmataceae bacterium]
MIDEKRLQNAIQELLIAVGADPNKEGLKDTPKRAANMFIEMLDGMNYTNDEIAEMFDKSFDEDTLTDSKSLVVMKDIDIFSFCEHHLALMYDMTVDIAYRPNGKVIGLSKLARIADMVSKRLQLQERITKDILYIIKKITNANDIYVRIKGCHSCVSARGIKKKSYTITKSKIGNIMECDLN